MRKESKVMAEQNEHTPSGMFDMHWVHAINGALSDRELTIRITDITDELWDTYIGPMVDAIEDGDIDVPWRGVQ